MHYGLIGYTTLEKTGTALERPPPPLPSQKQIIGVSDLTSSYRLTKIRSHARAVTDLIFVPELTASPRPQATGMA